MIKLLSDRIKKLTVADILSNEYSFYPRSSPPSRVVPVDGVASVMVGLNSLAIAVHWPNACLTVVIEQEYCGYASAEDWGISTTKTAEATLAECVNMKVMNEVRALIDL